VLYRTEGEPATNRSIPFADVEMDSWYANAVTWAQQNGIINGVSETQFSPNDNITREQIAAIMYRYAKLKGMDAVTLEENLHFADANEISEYAVSAMNWAVGTGLMKGKSTTTINPKDNATRAEIAAILQRFMEANK
ncbi:MAG: S-layer homology domain-containing protein, partial [Ruminococcaceae bacterium]|nr:S-layer homology domain-containing protein [Oscillospiraceae bacterium]